MYATPFNSSKIGPLKDDRSQFLNGRILQYVGGQLSESNIVYCDSEEDRERKIAEANEHARRRAVRSRQRAKSGVTRTFVMRRAKLCCEICAFNFHVVLVVHHIIPVSHGGSAQVKNLIAICPNCHALVHHYAHYRRPEMWDSWISGLASCGYNERAARRLLLVASQEAVMNHDGSIQPHARPDSTCYLLIDDLKPVGGLSTI